MIAQSNSNFLRWLLRRGSPLPIPNRVVKPASADGTAVMWESMSSPFFIEPQPFQVGVLFFIDTTRVRKIGDQSDQSQNLWSYKN